MLTSGDGLSVQLLLKHGASVNTRDHSGLTPLHWAVVKGSSVCTRHLLLAGADLNATEENDKTPRDMAGELKATYPLDRALEEANFTPYGQKIEARFSPRITLGLMYALPIVTLFIAFMGFNLSWYFAWPIAIAASAATQMVRPSRTSADLRSP